MSDWVYLPELADDRPGAPGPEDFVQLLASDAPLGPAWQDGICVEANLRAGLHLYLARRAATADDRPRVCIDLRIEGDPSAEDLRAANTRITFYRDQIRKHQDPPGRYWPPRRWVVEQVSAQRARGQSYAEAARSMNRFLTGLATDNPAWFRFEMTGFGFSEDDIERWLVTLRARGVDGFRSDEPVGPRKVQDLLRPNR